MLQTIFYITRGQGIYDARFTTQAHLHKVFLLQQEAGAATGIQVDEPSLRSKAAEVAFCEEVTAEDGTLYRNALWLQRNEALALLPYNMGDGVHQPNMLFEHIENTGNPTDVGMEKEDRGLMMFTF